MAKREAYLSTGPMGPQNEKWKSVVINGKPNTENQSKFARERQENLNSTRNKLDAYNLNQNIMETIPVSNLENEASKHYQQQNEYLRQYNEKLVKIFKDKSQGRGVPLYDNNIFADSANSLVKQTILGADYISPLVKALEDENQVLKDEMHILSADLSSFIDVVELLIDENKELREHINMKNNDFIKLLETIGLNDGEQIQDLKHKIHIITEENNLLLKHLDDLKSYKDNYDNIVFGKEQEMAKFKDLYDQMEYDLNESKKREDLLSRQMESIQPKYQELSEQSLRNESEMEKLKYDLNKQNNENKILKSQLDFVKKTNEDLELQKHLENDQLIQENHLLIQSSKDFKMQLQEKLKENDMLQENMIKMKKEIDELKFENEEISQSLSEKDVQLGLQKTRVEGSLQRERELNEKIENGVKEIQKMQLKYQQLERQYNNVLDNQRMESNEKHARYEKLIETLKMRHKEQIEQKEEEVDTNIRELENFKRQYDSLLAENNSLKEQLSKTKEKENVQKQQRTIEEMKLENDALRKQITKMKQLGDQENKKLFEEMDEKLALHQRKIREAELETDKVKKKNEDLHNQMNKLKNEIENNIDEKKDLKDQINNYQKMQPENVQALINENRELRDANRNLTKRLQELNQQNTQTIIREGSEHAKKLRDQESEINSLKKELMATKKLQESAASASVSGDVGAGKKIFPAATIKISGNNNNNPFLERDSPSDMKPDVGYIKMQPVHSSPPLRQSDLMQKSGSVGYFSNHPYLNTPPKKI